MRLLTALCLVFLHVSCRSCRSITRQTSNSDQNSKRITDLLIPLLDNAKDDNIKNILEVLPYEDNEGENEGFNDWKDYKQLVAVTPVRGKGKGKDGKTPLAIILTAANLSDLKVKKRTDKAKRDDMTAEKKLDINVTDEDISVSSEENKVIVEENRDDKVTEEDNVTADDGDNVTAKKLVGDSKGDVIGKDVTEKKDRFTVVNKDKSVITSEDNIVTEERIKKKRRKNILHEDTVTAEKYSVSSDDKDSISVEHFNMSVEDSVTQEKDDKRVITKKIDVTIENNEVTAEDGGQVKAIDVTLENKSTDRKRKDFSVENIVLIEKFIKNSNALKGKDDVIIETDDITTQNSNVTEGNSVTNQVATENDSITSEEYDDITVEHDNETADNENITKEIKKKRLRNKKRNKYAIISEDEENVTKEMTNNKRRYSVQNNIATAEKGTDSEEKHVTVEKNKAIVNSDNIIEENNYSYDSGTTLNDNVPMERNKIKRRRKLVKKDSVTVEDENVTLIENDSSTIENDDITAEVKPEKINLVYIANDNNTAEGDNNAKKIDYGNDSITTENDNVTVEIKRKKRRKYSNHKDSISAKDENVTLGGIDNSLSESADVTDVVTDEFKPDKLNVVFVAKDNDIAEGDNTMENDADDDSVTAENNNVSVEKQKKKRRRHSVHKDLVAQDDKNETADKNNHSNTSENDDVTKEVTGKVKSEKTNVVFVAKDNEIAEGDNTVEIYDSSYSSTKENDNVTVEKKRKKRRKYSNHKDLVSVEDENVTLGENYSSTSENNEVIEEETAEVTPEKNNVVFVAKGNDNNPVEINDSNDSSTKENDNDTVEKKRKKRRKHSNHENLVTVEDENVTFGENYSSASENNEVTEEETVEVKPEKNNVVFLSKGNNNNTVEIDDSNDSSTIENDYVTVHKKRKKLRKYSNRKNLVTAEDENVALVGNDSSTSENDDVTEDITAKLKPEKINVVFVAKDNEIADGDNNAVELNYDNDSVTSEYDFVTVDKQRNKLRKYSVPAKDKYAAVRKTNDSDTAENSVTEDVIAEVPQENYVDTLNKYILIGEGKIVTEKNNHSSDSGTVLNVTVDKRKEKQRRNSVNKVKVIAEANDGVAVESDSVTGEDDSITLELNDSNDSSTANDNLTAERKRKKWKKVSFDLAELNNIIFNEDNESEIVLGKLDDFEEITNYNNKIGERRKNGCSESEKDNNINHNHDSHKSYSLSFLFNK